MNRRTLSVWVILTLVAVLLVVLAACQAPPLAVGNKYMDAVVRNDTEAMIATISDDMAMIVDGGPFFHNEMSGKEALREYSQGNVTTGFRLELTGDPVVAGNQLTYPDRFAMDAFRDLGVEWINGVDVVTIENGKVTRDVWTIDEASVQQLAAVFAALESLAMDELAGTWRWDGGEGIGVSETSFHQDGTYRLIRMISGAEVLWDVGTYAIEGDQVALTTSEAHYCKVGDQGVYRTVITEDGRLEQTPIEDSCWRRKPPVEEAFYLERVTP
jgi:hypothetical protein